MADINRLKVVLVEKNGPTNGWPNSWAKILQLSQNGVQTLHSPICRL